MSLYHISRSFEYSFTFLICLKRTRSLTFFIPVSHARYIHGEYYSHYLLSHHEIKNHLVGKNNDN